VIILRKKNSAESLKLKAMRAEEERLERERLQVLLEMAGAVCHELNQPLQGIYGYSQSLLMKLAKDDQRYAKIKKIIELTILKSPSNLSAGQAEPKSMVFSGSFSGKVKSLSNS